MSVLNLDSTLIRRGSEATTFGQMADFASRIERRPLEQLMGELPGLAQLSEMKFRLARQVIRRRSRELEPAGRDELRAFAEQIAASAPALVARRIREIFI